MDNITAYLIYCVDNQNIANYISNSLGRIGIHFVHDTFNPATHDSIREEYSNSSAPIFLLVSDNFLKTEASMRNIMEIVEDTKIQHRIKAVILEGRYKIEGTNEYETVPTKFERLGDVVTYINFWLAEYQSIRTEMRNASEDRIEELEPSLEFVQAISTNILGDFMRYLRDTNYVSYQQLKSNNFRQLFEAFGEDSAVLMSDFMALPTYVEPEPEVITTEETVVETTEEETVEEEINIADIPGMSLLQDLDNSEDTETEEDNTSEDAEDVDEAWPDEEIDDSELDDILTEGEDLLDLMDELADELAGALADDSIDDDTLIDDSISLTAIADEEEEENDEVLAEDNENEEVATEEAIDEEEEEEVIEETIETEEETADETPAEEEWDEENDLMLDDIIDDLLAEKTETEADHEEETPEESSNMESDYSDELAEAIESYLKMIDEEPDSVDLRYTFAMMLIENDVDIDLAKQHLLEASKLDKEDEDVLFALGVISESEGNFEDAKGYYESVILLDLEHEQAYYRLGCLLANAFENQEFVASSYLQRAISLDDEYSEAYFEYAKILNTYFGKSKKAAKCFKKAIKNNRHFAEAHFELAKIYHQQGKDSKALQHYEDAVEINNRFQTDENDEKFGVSRQAATTEETPSRGLVMITGATSGIGQATAEMFAVNGFNLIITGRREERLMDLKHNLESQFSTKIQALVFDVREQEAVYEAIDSLEDEWRNIDILVNNAGLAKGFIPIDKGNLEHWETMIDTNLKGLLYVTRAVSPLMVANQKGFIVNIGSIAGKGAYPNGNVYCATKAAVDSLTKGMRLDLYHHNIRVAGIHPGNVETEFAINRFDGDKERAKIYDGYQPLEAMDVADAIYYVSTRPAHVNIEDMVIWATQQASATMIDRSGREKFQ